MKSIQYVAEILNVLLVSAAYVQTFARDYVRVVTMCSFKLYCMEIRNDKYSFIKTIAFIMDIFHVQCLYKSEIIHFTI